MQSAREDHNARNNQTDKESMGQQQAIWFLTWSKHNGCNHSSPGRLIKSKRFRLDNTRSVLRLRESLRLGGPPHTTTENR